MSKGMGGGRDVWEAPIAIFWGLVFPLILILLFGNW